MSIEDNIRDVEGCEHFSARFDGHQDDGDGGLLEQYTCRHPNKDIPQCHGTFYRNTFELHNRIYGGREDGKIYWYIALADEAQE